MADWKGSQLRLLAHLTSDPSLPQPCNFATQVVSTDFHSVAAQQMFKNVDVNGTRLADLPLEDVKQHVPALRNKAKTLNFGIVFGKTTHGIAKDFISEPKEAADTLKNWMDIFPNVKNLSEKTVRTVSEEMRQNNGVGELATLFGRRRIVDDADLCKNLRGARTPDTTDWPPPVSAQIAAEEAAAKELAENSDVEMDDEEAAEQPEQSEKEQREQGVKDSRCAAIALNFPVQGLEADLLKRAVIEIDAELEKECLDAFLVHTVHDEVILELIDDEQTRGRVEVIVKHAMEGHLPTAMSHGAPALLKPLKLDCDFVASWGTAEAHGGGGAGPRVTAVKKRPDLPKPDNGRKLQEAVDKISRREQILKDTRMARRIRGDQAGAVSRSRSWSRNQSRS